MMDVRPIRSDEDHRAALHEIEQLWGAAEGSSDGDRLEVLATLVDRYEEERWPIRSGDPIETLRFAIEEMGRSQSELAELLGSRSRASEIMNRRRPLTVEMVHRLSQVWKIPAEMLVRPYTLSTTDARRSPKRREVARTKPARSRARV